MALFQNLLHVEGAAQRCAQKFMGSCIRGLLKQHTGIRKLWEALEKVLSDVSGRGKAVLSRGENS